MAGFAFNRPTLLYTVQYSTLMFQLQLFSMLEYLTYFIIAGFAFNRPTLLYSRISASMLEHVTLFAICWSCLPLTISHFGLRKGKLFIYLKLCCTFCAVGWSDFEKNATHSMLCQIVVGPKIQNCLNIASFLGRRASENLDGYPKNSKI